MTQDKKDDDSKWMAIMFLAILAFSAFKMWIDNDTRQNRQV